MTYTFKSLDVTGCETPVVTLDWHNKRDPLILLYAFVITGEMGFAVTIPPGFRSDGGSIPRFLWWFVDRFAPTFLIGFLLHDYIYRNRPDSRAQADLRLKEVALQCNANWFKVYLIYIILRLTGWVAWRQNKRK